MSFLSQLLTDYDFLVDGWCYIVRVDVLVFYMLMDRSCQFQSRCDRRNFKDFDNALATDRTSMSISGAQLGLSRGVV